MNSGKARVIFLTLVLVVAVLCGSILLFLGGESTGDQRLEDERFRRSEASYVGIRMAVDAFRREGRLADSMRAYKGFPREFLNTDAGRRVEREQVELVKEITSRYNEDRKKLTLLIVGNPEVRPPAPPDYFAALDLIEKMELYCYDRMLKDILQERQRIQDYFDRQIRDLYLQVQSEFRARMEKRAYREALQWMHDFVDRARLPDNFDRRWIQFKPVSYPELKDAVQSNNLAKIAVLIEPHLAMLGKVDDMDTARMILFDILSASYGCRASEEVASGLAFLANERATLQSSNLPGKVRMVLEGGKYFWVGETENRLEVPPVDQMELEDMRVFMIRGSNKDPAAAVKAEALDAGFNMRLGIVFMFAPTPRDFLRAGECFRRAARLGAKHSRIFQEILTHSRTRGPK